MFTKGSFVIQGRGGHKVVQETENTNCDVSCGVFLKLVLLPGQGFKIIRGRVTLHGPSVQEELVDELKLVQAARLFLLFASEM